MNFPLSLNRKVHYFEFEGQSPQILIWEPRLYYVVNWMLYVLRQIKGVALSHPAKIVDQNKKTAKLGWHYHPITFLSFFFKCFFFCFFFNAKPSMARVNELKWGHMRQTQVWCSAPSKFVTVYNQWRYLGYWRQRQFLIPILRPGSRVCFLPEVKFNVRYKTWETYESCPMMPDRKFENLIEILSFLPG